MVTGTVTSYLSETLESIQVLLIPKSYQVFNPAMALFIHLVDTPVTNQDFNILNYMYVLFYTCGGKLFLKMKQ